MLEWVLFLSQLGLWVAVIQLYRTRSRERQNLQLAAEQRAQEESVEFDFLDTEAVTRMATIRTLLDEIEERTQRITTLESSTKTPSIPPSPTSAGEREELTAFLAPKRRLNPVPIPSQRNAEAPSSSHAAPEMSPAESRTAAPDVRGLANTGLDATSIARSTGRQREEVNLLLHLARKPGPAGSGGAGPLTNEPEGRQP